MARTHGITQPPEAELRILHVLWEYGRSTVREVYDHLGEARPIAYTTVLTQLQAMHKKGLVVRDDSTKTHVYRAAKPRQQVERNLVKSLIARAFAGSARNLVMHALSLKRASPEEMERINKLFDKLEGPQE